MTFGKFKLYTADKVIEYAKAKNIDLNEYGSEITVDLLNKWTSFCKDRVNERVVTQGFFFVEDAEDAGYLGGPFLKHFGFVRVTHSTNPEFLMTMEESVRDNFRWEMDLLKKYPNGFQHQIILNQHLIQATVEQPYSIYICGNDDASWTKTCKDEGEVNSHLWKLCLSSGDKRCGGFQYEIQNSRYIFTN
jgi:hypothetical protein